MKYNKHDFSKWGRPDKCLHDSCPNCGGNGSSIINEDGKNKKYVKTPCIHMISCPCSKCSPYSMLVR